MELILLVLILIAFVVIGMGIGGELEGIKKQMVIRNNIERDRLDFEKQKYATKVGVY